MRRSKGTSLIEVLVVATLITIMTGLLMPVFNNSRNAAKLAICTKNMKQIYNAVCADVIARKSNLQFPEINEWQSFTEEITEPNILICPSDSEDHFKLLNNKIDFIPPPPSVEFNELQSDTKIRVFREKESFILPQDVEAITEPGTYGRKIGTFDSTGIIPAGTEVDVYYFHFDPKTNNNEGSTEMHVSASDRVTGFIGRNDPGDYELNDTDILLGLEAEGLVYEKHIGRRLEGGDDRNADRITLPEERNMISYDSSTANPKYSDSMRVLTQAGAGSSYAMNGEIGRYMNNQLQIFLVDAYKPVVDFDDQEVDQNSIFPDVLAARHNGKVNVVFIDGSVELMEPEQLDPESFHWRDGR